MSLVLTDIAVQRQVLLERLKAAEVRKFTAVLRQVDEEIRRQLSGNRLTDFRRSRLEAQLAGIKTALKGHYSEYNKALSGTLEQLAGESSQFEANTFRAFAPSSVAIATPAPQQVWSAVKTNPLTMVGATGSPILEKFMEGWAEGDAEMVVGAVRTGYLLGETNDQIIGRIRGNAATRYADGVLATNRAHAEAVTRTAIQHVANSARAETWAANSDIIEEYQWVSTLDSRTTPLCRDRDGKRFPVGKGPLPPAHPNCRSTTVAVIGGEFGKALDEESTRASINGPVKADETYYDWLKRQPPGFQDTALGPTRGKLFRDGGLSTDEFSKLQLGKNFEPMTLPEMRAVAPEAFAKAGLLGPGASVIGAPSAAAFDGPAALSADTFQSLKAYSGSGYKAINTALRKGTGPQEMKEHAVRIANHLAASGLRQDAVLYRGINLDFLLTGERKHFNPLGLVGAVFEDPAFMSFTRSSRVAGDFISRKAEAPVIMRLSVERGESGFYDMVGVSQNPAEQEVLRIGGRFRIVAWDPDSRILDIEPLP